MKELEAESARLHKMYVDEKFKVEIVTEALKKSGTVVSPPRDGSTNGTRARHIGPTNQCGI